MIRSGSKSSHVFGVYYNRYEPIFYTGFAPHPYYLLRIHLHLGRGNQLRVTGVLADDVLGEYAEDFLDRYRLPGADQRPPLNSCSKPGEFEQTLKDTQVEQRSIQWHIQSVHDLTRVSDSRVSDAGRRAFNNTPADAAYRSRSNGHLLQCGPMSHGCTQSQHRTHLGASPNPAHGRRPACPGRHVSQQVIPLRRLWHRRRLPTRGDGCSLLHRLRAEE